jgi:signal transduction histidine kinase
MTLSIIALCLFVFGAYAYGAAVVLSLRHHYPVWKRGAMPAGTSGVPTVSLMMFVVCTAWFVLHGLVELRALMGDSRENDYLDLALLELVFVFPGLIFHTVLREAGGDATTGPLDPGRGWSIALIAMYAAGAGLALYFTAAILGVVAAPVPLGRWIGLAVGGLFTVTSVLSLVVIAARPRQAPTPDQHRLRASLMGLFAVMIGLFFALSFVREQKLLIAILDLGARLTPLAFLVVSVYFENRLEFYDLVVKRGALLLVSLALLGAAMAAAFGALDAIPAGASRAWVFAVVLVPIAMAMPFLHDWIGRRLDRLWFGRHFTPVEAVKHVLAAMQQATDEPSLVAAAERTLSEMFRRPVHILLEDGQRPRQSTLVAEVPLSMSTQPVRVVALTESGVRPLLSEDVALLRSLAGVFGFMLENVRLQRKRREQEQLAQDLRLQTSRSELKALRAQINPHFLFNALNAIASLIHTDPSRADAAVEQLAEVFRYTLRRSDQEWAPLDQELSLARAYLDVEQARFGRRLEFAIDADPTTTHAQVPSMLLQTLVENAVKHGISTSRGPGRIDVRTSAVDGHLILEVRDTGPGPEADSTTTAAGEGFGLRSVRDRLRGHFGARASLDLLRDGDRTVARMVMPLVESPAPAGAVR